MNGLNWKPTLIGCCIGAMCAFSAAYAVDAASHIRGLSAPSDTAVSRPLKPLQVEPSWVKEGKPKFYIAWSMRTKNHGAGIWACDGPTAFEWTFTSDEQVYILEGQVDVTYLGNRFTLKPGDTALFLAGTTAEWEVDGYVKKAFTLKRPNVAVRWYRDLVDLTS